MAVKLIYFPLALFTVLFAGCMVGPDFSQPGVPTMQHQYFAKIGGEPAPIAEMEMWWSNFKDPRLNELIRRANVQSLTLRQAYERIVEARAIVCVLGGQLRPTGGINTDYSYTKRSQNARPFVAANGDPFDLFNLGVDSIWQLDLFGKIKRGIEAAEAEVSLNENEFQYLRQTLSGDIASSYLRIRILQEQVSLVEESLLLQSDTALLVFERTEAGVSTELDRRQTEAFRFRTRALLASLRQQIEVEFNRLSLLLGQTPDLVLREFVGLGSLPSVPPIPDVGVPADLVRRRPDVWRDEMAVRAASSRIGVAEADLYPQLSLLGSIAVSSKNISGLFETDGLTFSVGPSLSWNILQLGPIRANIEANEARLRQSIAKYQETAIRAVHEVEDALVRHHGSIQQWNAFRDAIKSDRSAVDLSLERYRAGKANFQRVLDAQQQLLQDRQDLAAVQGEAITQLIRLYQAAGGGWDTNHCRPMVMNAPVGHGPATQDPFSNPQIQEVPGQIEPMEDEGGDKNPPAPSDDNSFEIYELENVTPPMPKKEKPVHAMLDSEFESVVDEEIGVGNTKVVPISGSAEPGTIPAKW